MHDSVINVVYRYRWFAINPSRVRKTKVFSGGHLEGKQNHKENKPNMAAVDVTCKTSETYCLRTYIDMAQDGVGGAIFFFSSCLLRAIPNSRPRFDKLLFF